MAKFQPKDIVYYDDTRLIVMAGPFQTWEYPSIDQYAVKTADPTVPECLWGRTGLARVAWGSDLTAEKAAQVTT